VARLWRFSPQPAPNGRSSAGRLRSQMSQPFACLVPGAAGHRSGRGRKSSQTPSEALSHKAWFFQTFFCPDACRLGRGADELRDRPVFCGLIGRSFTLAFAIPPYRLRPVSGNQISYQSIHNTALTGEKLVGICMLGLRTGRHPIVQGSLIISNCTANHGWNLPAS